MLFTEIGMLYEVYGVYTHTKKIPAMPEIGPSEPLFFGQNRHIFSFGCENAGTD